MPLWIRSTAAAHLFTRGRRSMTCCHTLLTASQQVSSSCVCPPFHRKHINISSLFVLSCANWALNFRLLCKSCFSSSSFIDDSFMYSSFIFLVFPIHLLSLSFSETQCSFSTCLLMFSLVLQRNPSYPTFFLYLTKLSSAILVLCYF